MPLARSESLLLVQGGGEVDGAAVGAKAGAVVVGCPGGELLGGRQQAGGRHSTGSGAPPRAIKARPVGATRGSASSSWHLDEEQLQGLVGGIAQTVHPVLEIGDQPGVLAAGSDAVDTAVPALLRRPGTEDDAPGIGRPGEGADPQRSRRYRLGFAAGCFHHMELRLSARGGAQESEDLAVRRKVRRGVTEIPRQPAGPLARIRGVLIRASPPRGRSTTAPRRHRHRSPGGSRTPRRGTRQGARRGRKRN